MSFLLFQISCVIYFLSTAAYLVFFLSENKKIRLIARGIFFGGAVLHTLNIVFRYIEAGHTPITSTHETISFFAWATAWSYLSFRWRYTVKNLGTFVSMLVFVLMMFSAFSSREIIPLKPIFQTWWLPAHASITILAYAFFALSSIGSAMYLLQEREIKQKRFGLFYSRLPSLEVLDKLNHHCLSVGFPMLTLGMITGILWSKQAWGVYWRWDPKETWSLVTWFIYAGVMHQRFTVGWRGRRVAIISIIAFVSAIFTLWGVSFFLEGAGGYGS